MKYLGKPNSFVIDYDKLKHVFQFDSNGEFQTDDEKLIAWMKKNKSFIRSEEKEPVEEIKEEIPVDEVKEIPVEEKPKRTRKKVSK